MRFSVIRQYANYAGQTVSPALLVSPNTSSSGGFDDTEPARQRYECHDCDTRFDDLTDTIFAGHHQPLKVWILCLYFMGLNLSNEQMAQELALNGSDVQQMTAQLREGIVKKSPR